MKTLRTFKKLTILACMVATIVVWIGYVQNAEAGWGIKDLDPTNKNSGIRQTGREIDEQRINETSAYKFVLRNRCPASIKVTFEYIPVGSSDWTTVNYDFEPGEHAFLNYTRNRNVYVSAKSTKGNLSWERTKVNMGANFLEYTHTLSCE